MTRDDVLRMAREADIPASFIEAWADAYTRFATIVAAAERERCAQICDAEASVEGIAQRCAANIRGMT